MYMFPIVLEIQLRGQWTWWIPNFCIKFWIWASWIPLIISMSWPIYLLLLLPLIHGSHACGSSSTNWTREMCFIYFKMYLKESIETLFFNEWFLRNLKGFFYMSHPYYCYVFLTGCSILLMKSMDNKCGKLSGWLLDYKFNLHSKQL